MLSARASDSPPSPTFRQGASEPGESPLFRLDPWRVRNFLLVTAALLTGLSLVGLVVRYGFGHDRVFGLIRTFDVDREANVPTWFTSVLLLFASVLFWGIGRMERRRALARAWGWLTLAGIYLVMSIDEVSGMHENVGRAMARLGGPDELAFHLWVIPGSIVLVALVLLFLRFVRNLPHATRRRLLIAWTVYVGGALVVEALGASVALRIGHETATYALITHLEEFLEMAGVALLIYTLLRHMASLGEQPRIWIART